MGLDDDGPSTYETVSAHNCTLKNNTLFNNTTATENYAFPNLRRPSDTHTLLSVHIPLAVCVRTVRKELGIRNEGVYPARDNIATDGMVRAWVMNAGRVFVLDDVAIDVHTELPVDHFVLDKIAADILCTYKGIS
jgi:hypothetical protein